MEKHLMNHLEQKIIQKQSLNKELIRTIEHSLRYHYNNLCFLPNTQHKNIELILILENQINMFLHLIEPIQTSQDILVKITGELINKYSLKDILNLGEFTNDLDVVLHQIKLYHQTFLQLSGARSSQPFQGIVTLHHQIYKIMDFLITIIKKQNRNEGIIETGFSCRQSLFCQNCNNNVHHKNVKELQKQLFDGASFHYQKVDISDGVQYDINDDERMATPEEILIKKMSSLQKNINERQINLVRCIQQFQKIHNDTVLGLRKRQLNSGIQSFDLKQYSFTLTKHFMSNLNRVQQKIANLKRTIHETRDQQIQVNIQTKQAEQINASKIEFNKPMAVKSELDIRRLNDMKFRLEEACKKYQLEIRDLNARVEVLDIQNKTLRDQIVTEKFKAAGKESIAKKVEKQKQVELSKKQQIERMKKESILSIISENSDLANEISNRFLQTFNTNSMMSHEEMGPMIKANFKRTLDTIMSQRVSMMPLSSMGSFDQKLYNRDEESPIRLQRKSRRKTIRIASDSEVHKQLSRFALKRNTQNRLSISNQVNLKVVTKERKENITLLNENQQKKSINNSYKVSILHTEGSFKMKNNNGKLSSLSRDLKNLNKSKQTLERKKYSQFFDNDQENLLENRQLGKKKIKKTKFNRNYSQLEQIRKSMTNEGILQSFSISSIQKKSLDGLDSKPIKQFLFVSDLTVDSEQSLKLECEREAEYRHKLSIEPITQSNPSKKQKNILNLDELNYLTNFYTLLAKLHVLNTTLYAQLKKWVLSKKLSKTSSEYEKNNLILKQTLSQIIVKHRQCNNTKSLCSHLNLFLREIEKFMQQK